MRIVALLLSASWWGCDVGELPLAPTDDAALDATALQSAATWNQLPRINSKAYVSAIGSFDINVFVSGDVADFRQIHPETNGSHVKVAEGTVIVRAVLDGSGAVEKLTLMAKGPPGYDATLGDWWFGVTDPTGTPLVTNGVPQIGRLTDCHTCHAPRASDDFVFGVPRADD